MRLDVMLVVVSVSVDVHDNNLSFSSLSSPSSMGMWSTLKIIYTENGVMKGLYRGMSINYLRAIPMVAVSFATYEMMKQTLNLDTGMSIK
jgi:hypothetical protein